MLERTDPQGRDQSLKDYRKMVEGFDSSVDPASAAFDEKYSKNPWAESHETRRKKIYDTGEYTADWRGEPSAKVRTRCEAARAAGVVFEDNPPSDEQPWKKAKLDLPSSNP